MDEQVLTGVIYLMDMKRLCLVFVVVTVSALAAVIPGCDSSMEGYKVFTFNKLAHFSFEYPRHYKQYAASADVEDKALYIGFRDMIVPEKRTNGFMYIYAEGTGITYPDAHTALEHHIQLYVEPENILESSTITVAGISFELLVYSHEPELIPEAPISNVMKVTRVAYFEHNDLIWEILMESDEDRAEVAAEDFEHLLETFQILD